MQHGREDCIRAVLEGISLNLRIILEALEEQGIIIDAVRLIGGGARGRVWQQILADVYGRPVLPLRMTAEATSLGAAITGGVGVGIFPDFNVAEQLTQAAARVEPNPENRSKYNALAELFDRAYLAFEPLFASLAGL